MQRKLGISTIGIFIFLAAFAILSATSEKGRDLNNMVPKVQKNILDKENQLESLVQKYNSSYSELNNIAASFSVDQLKSLHKEDITLYFFLNDSLVWWTDNTASVDEKFNSQLFYKSFIYLPNGWYLSKVKAIGDFKILALALIKHDYKYQNAFLQDEFASGINLPEEVLISSKKINCPIYSNNGAFLFGLEFSGKLPISKHVEFLLFVLFVGFVFCVLSFLKTFWFLMLKNREGWALFYFIASVFLFRMVMFVFKIPHTLVNTEFFQPFDYAVSDLFPSLGDIFISLMCFLHCTWVVLNPRKPSNSIKPKRKYDIFVAIVFILGACVILFVYMLYLKHFVWNSSFELLLDNLLAVDETYVILVLVICMISFSSYLLFWKFCDIAGSFIRNFPRFILISILCVGFFSFLIYHFSSETIPATILILFILALFLIYILGHWKGLSQVSISTLILTPLIFATFSTAQMLHYSSEKGKIYDKLIIEKLSIEENPNTELLFSDAEEKITSDAILKEMLQNGVSESVMKNYIKRTYFSKGWEAYDLNLAFCRSENNTTCDKKHIGKNLPQNSRETSIKNLYIVTSSESKLNLYWAAPIAIQSKPNDTIWLYVKFSEKDYLKYNGFIILRLDGSVFAKINILRKYCHAKYVNTKLVSNEGKYFYPTKLPKKATLPALHFTSYPRNGYFHLIYTTENPQVVWVLSKKETGLEHIFRGSFHLFLIFVLFSLFVYPLGGLKVIFPEKKNFRRYFQFIYGILIIIPFLMVGLLFTYYFNNINNEKEKNFLTEKSSFVIADFQTHYNTTNEIVKEENEELMTEVKRCADIHKCDISVFDPKGKLLASSYFEIYEDGFFAPLMSQEAMKSLEKDELLSFYKQEQIGNRKYLTSYFPLKNEKNKIIAYISSSYFLESTQFRAELFPFLLDYTYMYILVALFSIVILSITAKRFTQPLQLIIQKMRALSLGTKNEKIQTEKTDEFGDLIRSYNRMVDKLEESAYLLTKSEREGTWKGMAKRLAHEIKNPLTPMNLSIQQLQRAWNDKSPEFDKRLANTSQMLLEQIKVLSSVVDEFVDLAGKPNAATEKVNLVEVIQRIIALHDGLRNVRFTLEIDENEIYEVIADSQQLFRAFLNLVKNSIQAMYPGDMGEINIKIEKLEKSYILYFSDNGISIPKSQQNLIFKSSFTTKKDGTGLGLPIVKAIIEGFGGSVGFDSKEYKGTTFIITLPISKKQNFLNKTTIRVNQ